MEPPPQPCKPKDASSATAAAAPSFISSRRVRVCIGVLLDAPCEAEVGPLPGSVRRAGSDRHRTSSQSTRGSLKDLSLSKALTPGVISEKRGRGRGEAFLRFPFPRLDLVGYGNQAYIPSKGFKLPSLPAAPVHQGTARLMRGQDVDKIQISRNGKGRPPRNSILVSHLVQAGPSGGICFAGVGFVRLPKTRGAGDPHLP